MTNIERPLETSTLNDESSIKQRLKQALAERPKKVIADPTRKASAVLVPIYYQDGRLFILFTKRTELVHHHKGQMSFPGGGFHEDDGTLLATALRESQEEIGLDPEHVEVLGELDDTLTNGSPYVISPFVGVIKPDYEYKTSAFEIAEISTVAIQDLLQENCRQEGPETMLNGQTVTAYEFSYGKYRITGATARIVKQFLDIYSAAICSVGKMKQV